MGRILFNERSPVTLPGASAPPAVSLAPAPPLPRQAQILNLDNGLNLFNGAGDELNPTTGEVIDPMPPVTPTPVAFDPDAAQASLNALVNDQASSTSETPDGKSSSVGYALAALGALAAVWLYKRHA